MSGDWLIRVPKGFRLHSGGMSNFKIEGDGLTDGELETFAVLIADKFKFSEAIGVPRGGWPIANKLHKYATHGARRLIVEDVLTTGASMELMRVDDDDIGVVLFARGPCPDWVTPVFKLW